MTQELTSADAADHLGITVQTWHRWAHTANLQPTRRIDGLRGARWWLLSDVEAVGRERQAAS